MSILRIVDVPKTYIAVWFLQTSEPCLFEKVCTDSCCTHEDLVYTRPLWRVILRVRVRVMTGISQIASLLV